MDGNLIEGLKLMVIGMSTVFVFLLLMILLINLVAFFTQKHAIVELEQIELEKLARLNKSRKKKKGASNGAPTAVITAAVSAYEADEKKQSS